MKPLTTGQQEVLKFIRERIEAGRVPLSLREITDEFRFISETNGARVHLVALKRKGYIDWDPGKRRTLRIIKRKQNRGMPLVKMSQLTQA